MIFEGSCHCGGVKVAFETAQTADALEVRADQCTFCKNRGAKTVSDPKGKLTVHTAFAHPYQFGLRTADFWICDNCGAYVAATTIVDGQVFGVLNVAGARIDDLARREANPVNYDGEDVSARQARRAARWTPAVIVD
jgi:hypothetical protein